MIKIVRAGLVKTAPGIVTLHTFNGINFWLKASKTNTVWILKIIIKYWA